MDFCKFVFMISRKLQQLGASNLVSRKRVMSRSIGENLKNVIIIFFSNHLPLQIWTLKIRNHDISKTVTARSFKLGQLIEDDEEINW